MEPSEVDQADVTPQDEGEVETKRPKLLCKDSAVKPEKKGRQSTIPTTSVEAEIIKSSGTWMNFQLGAISDAAKAKPDHRKERKEAKLLSKSPLKSRRSGSSQSPVKKEKIGSSAGDVCPSEAQKNQAEAPPSEEIGANDESQPAGGYSPVQKHFQRTLSPADVLHVHSYAKGDYGEGEAAVKEEKKVDIGYAETEERSRHLQHPVSRRLSQNQYQE